MKLLGSILAALLAAGILVWLTASRERRPPNVLLVTLDTLRADFAGRGMQTPGLEAFLDEATHFAGARTTVSLTLPAHVSLFSGLLPARHEIHDNATPPLPPRGARSFALLAEELADHGYLTVGMVSRPVLAPETGVAAGFERYSSPPASDPRMGERGYIAAADRLQEALDWLAHAPDDRPWFLWVHFFDPHFPYEPFEGDERRASTRRGAPLRALYAGEVRRTDAAVEKLLSALAPETIVVIASDHGEGLGEHDEPTHGPLCYATTTDLFLAVRGPGMAAGEVDHGPRSICDVAPTLRAWCGLPEVEDDARPLFGDPHEVVLSEALQTWRLHNFGQVFAACDGRYTLIEAGATLAIYDRKHDPAEKHPIDPVGHPAYERLDRALQRMRGQRPAGRESAPLLESVSPYNVLSRPGTGYLSRPENAKLLDPQPYLTWWGRVTNLRSLIEVGIQTRSGGRLQSAMVQLEELARKAPGSPVPHHYLAYAAGQLGALSGKAEDFRRAAHSQLAAIERGHDDWESYESALRYATNAKSPELVASILRSAIELRREAPIAFLRGAQQAARALDAEGEAGLLALAERLAQGGG